MRRDETRFPGTFIASHGCAEPQASPASLRVNGHISRPKKAGDSPLDDGKQFQLLLNGISDFAIYMLDPRGYVISWNVGAARLKGYQREEILGKHFSCFFPPEAIASGKPAAELQTAATEGRFEEECWRLRKDGSAFWANIVVTPMMTTLPPFVDSARSPEISVCKRRLLKKSTP